MKLTAEITLKGIAIAMGTLAALMAVSELRRALDEERVEWPAAVANDALRETLQRCRRLTPEALEADTECQAAWSENRHRFFGQPSDNASRE